MAVLTLDGTRDGYYEKFPYLPPPVIIGCKDAADKTSTSVKDGASSGVSDAELTARHAHTILP